MSMPGNSNEQPTVIDVDQLSSDIEVDLDGSRTRDDEIDLLDEDNLSFTGKSHDDSSTQAHKSRYREVVHAIRHLNHKLQREREQHEKQQQQLKQQITELKDATGNHNNKSTDRVSLSNVASEGDIASKHNSTKQSSKVRDLEELMAKCKKSLKAKNQQLKILKDSLLEVDRFKEYIGEFKDELKDLRHAHETWTLSIAENKRVMHQEIESKNLEIDMLKSEIKELQAQLKDNANKSLQLKSNIQALESRMVSTSAAHQKERESLTRELTATKSNAIKQLQRDYDLQLERVKLHLERSIENLKLELLVKDEQIIRNAERERELQEQNCSLKTDLEAAEGRLKEAHTELSNIRSIKDEQANQISALKKENEEIRAQGDNDSNLKIRNDELERNNQELLHQKEELSRQVEELSRQVGELSQNLVAAEDTNVSLNQKLEQSEQVLREKDCAECAQLKIQMSQDADRYKQHSFELKTKLDLMTTANSDQEKVLRDLKGEREEAIEIYKSLKLEFDELSKRNETISQVVQDNEAEMQNQQEQLEQLKSTKQQLESLKRENSSLISRLEQVNSELNDRLDDLKKSQLVVEDLKERLMAVEQEAQSISRSSEAFKRERDSLAAELCAESKRRGDLEQQLVVSILAAMKNLETPETSPGSDKTYNSDVPNPLSGSNPERNLPDPVRLAEELASLALDRSSAYLTSNQRLQAVMLDNTMINVELKRLKEELNALNKEKTIEVMSSLQEIDRLRTENQALIHDQKAYDDQIASLENEIVLLKNQISESLVVEPAKSDAFNSSDDGLNNQLELKEKEVEQLKQVIAEKEKLERDKVDQQRQVPNESDEVPNPTEFEYLKNIVYQFMMGREPTTLARVISAVFKFKPEQVEQICRVQEAIHQVTG